MARGGRIALQTVLGAIAGGAQGYAAQQEYNRQAQEREAEAKRRAAQDARERLNEAFLRAQSQMTEVTDTNTTFDPAMATRISVDGKTYQMPTARGLARQAAETQREIEGENTQIKRREAFTALQQVDPSYRNKTYNATVPYEVLYEDASAVRRAGAAARAQAAAYTARDREEAARQEKQERTTATAWWQRLGDGLAANSPEMLSLQRLYQNTRALLQSERLPSAPADVVLSMYRGAQAQMALGGRGRGGGSGGGEGGGGGGGGGGGTTPAGISADMLPRRGEDREKYYARIISLPGMTEERAYQLAVQLINDND